VKALPTLGKLDGVYAAAITPRGPTGDINFGAVFEIVDYLSAARVDGIALFTAWGEYPALAVDERARVTYLAVKRSRVPLLVCVGSATFDHSLELAREARSAGAAGILLPPPLFYQCDDDDLFEFYAQFAAQLGSDVPIIVTGEMDPETAGQLLDSGRFAGVVAEHGTALRNVIVGEDREFVDARTAGLGVLSAAACAAPELTMALNSAIAAGDRVNATRVEAKRQELLAWLDRFPAPVGIKTAVAARGIQTGPLPVPLSAQKQQYLEQFREWFKAWLPGTKKLALHA